MKKIKEYTAIEPNSNNKIKIVESIDKSHTFHYSKYFDEHNSIDLIHEIVEPDMVDISSIQQHDTLSPLLWNDDNSLKDEVRISLLQIAKRFIEYSNLTDYKFNDIIFTGSLANYNYTNNSDIDLHIILDFSQISENIEFAEELLKLKKTIWNDNLPIQIKGFVTEVYYQDINEILHASGTYSLMNNNWIIKPIKKIVNINTNNIKLKTAELMNAIDSLESNTDKSNWIESYEKLKDKIKAYRKSGLESSGEYSTENLVFKTLRNSGYLTKLTDMKNNYLKNELTLKEFDSNFQ